MPDVRKHVETVFSVTDTASKTLESIGGAMAHVGSVAQGVVSSVFSLGTAITGAVSGGAIAKLVGLSSNLEDTSLSIAGALDAFKVTSGGIEGALGVSRDMMAQMEQLAAALPGETEDYVTILRSGLPAALADGVTDLHALTDAASRFGAVAISNQIDAAQAGRDYAALLRGHAGAQVRSWDVLMPHIQAVSAEMHKHVTSAQEFNRLSGPERVRMINAAVGRFEGMFGAASNTWSALSGTIKSDVRSILRDVGVPFFDDAKDSARRLHDWLTRNRYEIVHIGRLWSGNIVAGFHRVEEIAARLAHRVGDIRSLVQRIGIGDVAKGLAALQIFRGGGLGAVGSLAGSLFGGGGAAAGGLLGGGTAALGALTLAAVPLAAAFNQSQADVRRATSSLESAFDHTKTGFESLVTTVRPAVDALGQSLWHGVSSVAESLDFLAKGFANRMSELEDARGAISGFVAALRQAAGSRTWEVLFGHTPTAGDPDDALARAGQWVARRRIAARAYNIEQARGISAGTFNAGGEEGRMVGREGLLPLGAYHALERNPGTPPRPTPPTDRGGHGTYNDFRNSRFDISQKFAEGYDPDRIAILFAHDLGRVAEQRLQSGLEPAFGTQ